MQYKGLAAAILCLSLPAFAKNPQGAPNALALDAQAETQISQLIARMTLDEKVKLVSGNDPLTNPVKRLGIPSIVMNDGPLGLRLGLETAFPAGVALGATFDPELSGEMGQAVADEARIKGVNMMLGPCVNIHRTPWGGRNFESYGEDPYLATQMVAPYVIEMQKRGVIATVKHFAVNDEEWNRHTMDVEVDERTLNEIHLPAFKAAVDAGVWSVMSAYNRVNGHYAAESAQLLQSILKGTWGFSGFVVSDWSGNHSTVAAANSGLDLEMPEGEFFKKLKTSVKNGDVSEATLDDKVRRLLRAMSAMGIMDPSQLSPLPAPKGPETNEHRQLAQKIAEEGIVLLKNNGVLPLSPSLKSIAVIGPNAGTLRTGGGGSSQVHAFEAVSPYVALKQRLQERGTIVRYAKGVEIDGDIWPAISPIYFKNGLTATYFKDEDFDGAPLFSRQEPSMTLDMTGASVGRPTYGVRWEGTLTAPVSGAYKFSSSNAHATKLYIDDNEVMSVARGSDSPIMEKTLTLTAGRTYAFKVETSHTSDDLNVPFEFGWDIPDANLFNEAVEAARASDIAILFVGLGNDLEAEGVDRETLTLPADQLALMDAVMKANPKTIVIMNSGSVSLMQPWLGQASGVMQAWYPGEEGGWALARLLLGDVSPSGKLPETSLKRWEDSSAYGNYPGDPKTQTVTYKEGVFVGYRFLDRNGTQPEFPFGFGLSYTTFAIKNLKVNSSDLRAASPSVRVSVDVTNTGRRAGAEVVQVYVGEVQPSVPRPPRELKGFARVNLQPGQTKTVEMALDRSAFAFWDVQSKGWKVNAHAFKISVGSSSRHLPVSANVQLQ